MGGLLAEEAASAVDVGSEVISMLEVVGVVDEPALPLLTRGIEHFDPLVEGLEVEAVVAPGASLTPGLSRSCGVFELLASAVELLTYVWGHVFGDPVFEVGEAGCEDVEALRSVLGGAEVLERGAFGARPV